MVNWEDLGRGAKLFRVGLDREGSSKIHCLSQQVIQSVMPAVQGDIRNRKLFDVLAKEVFFREKVVFCEGQEDVHYIENYLNASGRASIPLFGYGSGGASWIGKWLDLANDLGITAAAIFDANEKELANLAKVKHKDKDAIRVWILPANDVRDKLQSDGQLRKVFSNPPRDQ